MPGSLCRFGPAKLTGETRIDQTGSTRMLRPDVWISQLACPTKERRTLFPSTRGGGVSRKGPSVHVGHFARLRLLPNCQRSSSRQAFGGAPSGSKKRSPSKCPDLGP